MMRDQDIAIARELKEKIASITTLVDFKIFGSRARGDADEFSDLDVFIAVESLDKDTERKISEAAWEVGFAHYLVISPLVFTREEIENSPLRASPIVQAIAVEGVRI